MARRHDRPFGGTGKPIELIIASFRAKFVAPLVLLPRTNLKLSARRGYVTRPKYVVSITAKAFIFGRLLRLIRYDPYAPGLFQFNYYNWSGEISWPPTRVRNGDVITVIIIYLFFLFVHAPRIRNVRFDIGKLINFRRPCARRVHEYFRTTNRDGDEKSTGMYRDSVWK